MCNCINEMAKKLQDYTGDPAASVETEICFVKEGDKINAIVYPCVYGNFREKKKNGTLKDKCTTMPLRISHCPFCGEAYIK